MPRSNRLTVALLLLAALCPGAGQSSRAESQPRSSDLVIGVFASLTGDRAPRARECAW